MRSTGANAWRCPHRPMRKRWSVRCAAIRDAAATVDAFLDALPATVEPATRDIARAAAALRGRHARSLRLPDGLVLATADILGADNVLTTDAGWPDTGVDVRIVGPNHAKR